MAQLFANHKIYIFFIFLIEESKSKTGDEADTRPGDSVTGATSSSFDTGATLLIKSKININYQNENG